MTTYALIPGGGSDPWYWNLLVEQLELRGHQGVAVDLPGGDDEAGLTDYAEAVVTAVAGHTDVVVVAHSLGGFTGPLVCARRQVRELVMLTAMIPQHGESAADWWAATGHYTLEGETFYNGVDPEIAAECERHTRPESATAYNQPWPLETWPDVPTRVLLCRDDRFMPADFMRTLARERLGLEVREVPGGHLAMLSHPAELAETLVSIQV